MQIETQGNRQRWLTAGLCFIMIFIGLGFCSSCRSIFLSPISEALGVSRSAFSVSDSIRYITSAVMSVFFGTLVNRFGTKKLICLGFLFLLSATLIYSFARHLLFFYAAGLFFGLGFSFTTTAMVGCIIPRWFHGKTGTLMGVILGANGLGAAIASQVFTPMIYEEGNPFGYQNAFLLTSAIQVIAFILILIFYKEAPPVEKKAVNTQLTGERLSVSLAQAKKDVFFYITVVCVFLTGLILQGVSGIAAAHMKDVGLDPAFVGSMVSIQSLILIFSKISCGFLYDKLGLRFTVIICDVAAIAAIFGLGFLAGHGSILTYVYTILKPIALPLETLMLPIFARELMGAKDYSKILGIFTGFNTLGYAIGGPLLNSIFDVYGTYKPGLLAVGGIMVMIAVLFQLIIPHFQKLRKPA